ncbi:macrolide family glycosyltransferase [Paenibacillus arenosi]|uniref:Glycosyl transferase n=1 Tax=Paenibacillus arenosi TaxID=2774142 RepID=A0ABR9B1A4_9BACL|nr:glycosyl transferase [Paenibacillus arenosi]
MARILYVNIPSEGHVNPTIGLVKELVDNGEEVVYLCTEGYRKRIQQTGAEFRACQVNENLFEELGFTPKEARHPLQFIDFILRGIIEPHVPEIVRLVQNETFDYFIYDSMFGWGGSILEKKLGIPAICSVTHFAFTEPLELEEPSVDHGDLDIEALHKQTTSTLERIADTYQVTAPAIEDVFFHHGISKLVFTSRYFHPDADKLDASYILTGPSLTPRYDAPEFPFELLRSRYEQVAYISMGTIVNNDVEFYKLCFEAFQDIPVQFVLSCGKDTDLDPIGDCIPPNFIIEPYVPQLEILQRADVFITHAGMNSASEALYYDVPLVTIPLTSDQPMVAKRVEELGAGIYLDKKSLTAEGLRSALLQVLQEESYKKQAKQIGDSFREAGGYKEAANRLMSLFLKV